MTVKELRELARERGVKIGKLRKAELIRTIQADEANNPCYGTEAVGGCGQDGCLWRQDCVKESVAA